MSSKNSLLPISFVADINQLHHDTVQRWHSGDPDNPYEGVFQVVCQQHQYNFLLWHEEDVARSPDASDTRIAEVKRAIDGYNQQRNDWIERIDESLIELFGSMAVEPAENARLNTETPGTSIEWMPTTHIWKRSADGWHVAACNSATCRNRSWSC